MGVLLHELVWGIFEDVWTQQNTILHSVDSHVERAELTAATNKLFRYKRDRIKLLSPHDHHLIKYPDIDIMNWKSQKKNHLRNLDKCHKAWRENRRLRRAG